jgi:hypothetical protein
VKLIADLGLFDIIIDSCCVRIDNCGAWNAISSEFGVGQGRLSNIEKQGTTAV